MQAQWFSIEWQLKNARLSWRKPLVFNFDSHELQSSLMKALIIAIIHLNNYNVNLMFYSNTHISEAVKAIFNSHKTTYLHTFSRSL